MKLPNFSRALRFLIAGASACFLSLGSPARAWAQFIVTSVSPPNGATGVDTAATLELTFSAALDTSARFDWPEQFFLGVMIHPDTLTGEPDSIRLSPDLRTVRVHNLHLSPNTRYVFAIVGARSLTGAPLDMPAVVTITTGSALPTGKVAGTVSFPGNDPTATLVALFRNLFSDENPEALAVVASSAGTYAVNYVPAGTYWPIALKDINKNGSFDPEADIDAIGIYDPNGDGVLDSVVVAEGGSLTGINIALSVFAGITARQRYPDVQAASLSWSADARLLALGADWIAVTGKAGFWFYMFYSPTRAAYMGFGAANALIFYSPMQDGDLPDTTALPGDWIDSDVAIDSAQANGGSQFRAQYPDAEIFGSLSNYGGFSSVPRSPTLVRGRSHSRLLSSRLQPAYRRPAESQPRATVGGLRTSLALSPHSPAGTGDVRALWAIFYSSPSTQEYLDILLDARTGEYVEPFMPTGTTARASEVGANQAAAAWAADAQLVFVGALGDLAPSGQSMAWAFVYYSASKDALHSFYLMSGFVIGDEAIPNEHVPSKQALPPGWIDSNAATATAEASGGGQFRSAHSDAVVSALLSRNLLPGDPSRTIWKFSYYSASAQQVLDLMVDALTGGLIVGIEEKPPTTQKPEVYALAQNYPNPFNPTTKIEYQLPKASHVSLGVYSLTGQLVRELVDAKQPAGLHAVEWNGRDEAGRAVASGVYLYRLVASEGPPLKVAGQFIKTRKMVVIR